MTREHEQEIAANLERAELSIAAAKDLMAGGFHDFAASRAYYAAFYAATAALLREGLELGKHSGVIASVHQRLVKTGRLGKEEGKKAELALRIAQRRRLWCYCPRVATGCRESH